jgi:hypothetical protein
MKYRYSEKTIQKLAEKASFFGYQLIDLSERYDYCDRKYATYGLIDHRNNRLACAYSLIPDIERFLKQNHEQNNFRQNSR